MNQSNSQVTIDFASFSVFAKQSSENTLPPHPENLALHTGFSGTLSLTRASVTTLALRRESVPRPGTGVNNSGFSNDVTILEELLDMLAGVGVADLGLLSGVEPDLALANASDWMQYNSCVNDQNCTISDVTNQRLQVVFGHASS